MNRRNRALLVVGLALVMATLASYSVYRAIQKMPVREVQVATIFAVVAREALPVGTLVTAAQLKLVPWPEANPVEGGFRKVEDVIGRGLVTSIVSNEPITESKLAPREAGGGLPPLIPSGMRAMSVRVNDVIGVAGFTSPGTRVDVVVTMKTGQQESMSRVVVSNLQVLAAGTKLEQEKGRGGQAMAATVVVLLVTPEDAERIALAQTDGQITLALRNPLDLEQAQTNGIRVSGLMGMASAAPVRQVASSRPKAVTPPPAAPPAGPYMVEAIRGAKRTEETVK
jgi:pilus assembly protein CpaB